MVPVSSPAPHSDGGHPNLLSAYVVVVRDTLRLIIFHVIVFIQFFWHILGIDFSETDVLFLLCFFFVCHLSACLPPSKPENGGYVCHPSPCRMFAHGTVIEFVCDEGFVATGDYNYLTCQDGQWDSPMQITCISKGLSATQTLPDTCLC